MDTKKLHILRHALGVGDSGTKPSYRNHFVTGLGSKDYDNCVALVESGHMAQRKGSQLTGGDDLFIVTESGKLAALPEVQP